MIFQDQGFDWIEITDRYDLRGGRRVFLKGSAVAGSGNYGPGQPRVPDQLQPPYLCGCHNPPRPIGDHNRHYGATDRDQEIADQRSAEARDMKLHSPGCRGAFGVPCAEWCEVYTHNRSQPGPSTPEPVFQMQIINHTGSFINYGKPKTAEQCEENRRDRETRGSLAVEGQHFRFVRVN